jgi:hypothetical protein
MSHYFRLFNIDKYRKIQPIVEKINEHKATVAEVTPLVDEALSIAGTDEFEKYNNEGEYGIYPYRVLERIQDLIQEGRLSELPDIESDDMLRTIILVICCPRYQEPSIHVKEISDTYADYTDISHYMYPFNEDLGYILDVNEPSIYPLERIPSNNGKMGLFNKDQLAKIQLIVSRNVIALSHKKYDYLKKIYKKPAGSWDVDPSKMADVRSHRDLVSFHREFENVLKLACSQYYYTVINEYTFG